MFDGLRRRWSLVAPGFALLAAVGFVAAAGIAPGPALLVAAAIGIVLSVRFPYAAFALAVALIPAIGWFVSIPLASSATAEAAFGGSLDIPVSDIVAAFALAGWAVRAAWLGWRRRDPAWKPQFPVFAPAAAVVFAHVASAWSPLVAPMLPAFKYAVRPVAFTYVAFVFLAANLVRNPRRLKQALAAASVGGAAMALVGLAGTSIALTSGALLEATPIPVFGQYVFGDNHNAVGETAAYALPLALALVLLVRTTRSRRFAWVLAAILALAGVLSFTRSFWIALAVQLAFLAAAAPSLRASARRFVPWATFLLIPAGVGIVGYSLTHEAVGSLGTRATLADIAWTLFRDSPWIGAGAGTFVGRVSRTLAFVADFGAPLDAHGLVWKMMAETGIVGLAALLWLAVAVVRRWMRDVAFLGGPVRDAYLLIVTSAVGSFVYQLFSTSYWTGKLWFPIGLALAAGVALREEER